IAIHPRFLNPLLNLAGRFKKQTLTSDSPYIKHYPWQPLCGAIGFVMLRGSGFIVVMASFTDLMLPDFPLLLGAFSLSWFLG
ncbi:hypothetical protein SB769_39085, partial [Burkholderia sp. SIMBA_024]